jgi:hypothetical protein
MTNENEERKIDEVATKLCVIADKIRHKEKMREDAMASVFIRAFQIWVHALAPKDIIEEAIKSVGEMLILSAAQNKKDKMQ